MKYEVSLPRKMIEEIQTIMLKKLVKLLTSYKYDRREWSGELE